LGRGMMVDPALLARVSVVVSLYVVGLVCNGVPCGLLFDMGF
jgi:hypothetical protein